MESTDSTKPKVGDAASEIVNLIERNLGDILSFFGIE